MSWGRSRLWECVHDFVIEVKTRGSPFYPCNHHSFWWYFGHFLPFQKINSSLLNNYNNIWSISWTVTDSGAAAMRHALNPLWLTPEHAEMDGLFNGKVGCVWNVTHITFKQGISPPPKTGYVTHPNVEKAVCAHDNLVLRKAILLSRQEKVAWDSQTNIIEQSESTDCMSVVSVFDCVSH